MSNLRKKVGRRSTRETRSDNLIGDVTIDDFANTLRIHARFKKSITNMSKEVKQEVTKQEENSEWDKTDEEILLKDNTKGRRNRRKLKIKDENDEDEDEGIDYPLDIWFIISEYIEPEAVGKFAKICRSSYYVTTTAKFWFHLYKSYYKFESDLPERLQPQCMRLYGLRACVIRALHYNYFRKKEKERWKEMTKFDKWILAEKNDMSYLRQEQPHSLVKRKCILMWHKEGKGRWYFYFKLKEVSKIRNKALKQSKQCDDKRTEFFDTLEDVAVNPEDGCKVLTVSCSKYSMLPPVIGLVLQTVYVYLTSTRGLREHQLQLRFGTSDIPNTLTNQIILRNVVGYTVLNWWDPGYPHQDVSYMTELTQNDSWD